MAIKTFTAQDQEIGPFLIDGPFNVKVLTDPGGSILTLKESHDGTTWYTSQQGGSDATFNAKGTSVINNYGSCNYKLVCTTYVADTTAAMSSGRTKY